MLGLSATPAIGDRQYGVDHDPPNCYYEGGALKFNVLGENTGACSDEDVCLCTQSVIAVPYCACYCDSELENFTMQSGLLLLGYVVGSFFATVACLRTTQKQVTKLRSLRACVLAFRSSTAWRSPPGWSPGGSCWRGAVAATRRWRKAFQ